MLQFAVILDMMKLTVFRAGLPAHMNGHKSANVVYVYACLSLPRVFATARYFTKNSVVCYDSYGAHLIRRKCAIQNARHS